MTFKIHVSLFLFLFSFATFVTGQRGGFLGNLVVKSCRSAESPGNCSYEKVGKLLSSKLNIETIDSMLEHSKNKDTLRLSLMFVVNEKGVLHDRFFDSNFKKHPVIGRTLHKILKENITFNMPLNTCGQSVLTKKRLTYRFLIQKDDNSSSLSVVMLPKRKVKSNIEKSVITVPPVHKRCRKKTGSKALKKCLSQQVSQHIAENFRTQIIRATNAPNCATRIYVKFTVNKLGKVENVEALSSHPNLEAEAIWTMQDFPQVIPGTKDGKPVNFLYHLPIVVR